MALTEDASYGDHHYLSYKRDLEGTLTKDDERALTPLVGIAIFGLGRIGTIHVENLSRNPRAHIMYCIEPNEERLNFVRNRWRLLEPETKFLAPSEQGIIFKDKRVEAVIVCTPTFTHEELVLKSLEAGKAVFCEKPLSLDDGGIERCLAAAKMYSKPIVCAFNRRFDPGFRSLKSRVEAGEIGKIQIVKTCSRDSPKPSIEYLKVSGGIFHDCAVHDIDYICWILGEYPEKVSAFAHANYDDIKEISDYDTVSFMMKFPSGILSVTDLSRCTVYGYDQRVEVFGTKGMLMCGDLRPNGVKCHSTKGSTAVPIYFSFASRYKDSYVAEMEHFLNVVQGTEECEVNIDCLLATSKIASACEEAVQTGRSIDLHFHNHLNEST